ncbi:MAG: hypothetical protein K5905_18620 [Roseibium sp.]|uniref:hypothetical protein n=1 Tax=Roseibium sp. TaxID=1936156 RepID=UPI002605D9F9|nr:hypothetical protein [Roseibium sp.]MCV0427477.1 hypothetical protein [Roseibium sp.]
MKKFSAIFTFLCLLTGSVHAGAIPRPGDFFLISRNDGGIFVGSHKLFEEYSSGLTKVSYCQRDYFVRAQSVAWTQIESKRGNTVRIELNFGRGWRPICLEPETQVTLKDFGISISAEDFLKGELDENSPKSRLSAVRAVFQTKSPEEENKSYHTR